MTIHKFGGASVKDAASFRNLASIVGSFPAGQPVLIVVSAMGKTTNALENIYRLAFAGHSFTAPLEQLRHYHLQTALELFSDPGHAVFAELNQLLQQLEEKLTDRGITDPDAAYDQVIPFGELLSSVLLHHWLTRAGLQNQWLDCRTVLRTDLHWREATVDWPLTQQLISQHCLLSLPLRQTVVTQGFIGGTGTGLTSTLGREGSDYSAAVFAYCLGAASITIWKDVPGLLNADPKLFADTVKYEELSYQETIEMAYYGASVIHPKTIQPLAGKNIPLFVKSFADPAAPGTLIHNCHHEKIAPAIILKKDQTLVSVEARNLTFVTEHNLCDIFTLVSGLRIKLNVMQNSAVSFSFCFDQDENKFRQLLEGLSDLYKVHFQHGLQLYTIKNFDEGTIGRILPTASIILEQRTRKTFQAVVQSKK